jgi:hypothetical protein
MSSDSSGPAVPLNTPLLNEEDKTFSVEDASTDNISKKSIFSSLVIVYVTVFVDLLGFGIIIPLLPFYALKLGASGLWLGVITASYPLKETLEIV